MEFDSAQPSSVKSINQRDLLNNWLRLYVRHQPLPRMSDYRRARIEDQLPDAVFYDVDASATPPRLTILSGGMWMTNAYGHAGKGRSLDEYLGARMAPLVMPAYYKCIARRLPVYTISHVDDVKGRVVAYERLLLPFSDGDDVTQIIASMNTISEDGNFEIRNLMRDNISLPVTKLRAVIDRDLVPCAPGDIVPGDVLEFS